MIMSVQSVEAEVINHSETITGKSPNTTNAGNGFVSTTVPIDARVSDWSD